MNRRTLAILAAVAAIALVAISAAFAASPLENPGFETGDLSSWKTNPTDAGAWCTTSTGTAGCCSRQTNSPWEGSFSALWDMERPVGRRSFRRASPSRQSETLSFAFAYDNDAGEWVQDEEDPFDINVDADNEWLRIDVLESRCKPRIARLRRHRRDAFDSQSGEQPFDQGWQNVTVSLCRAAQATRSCSASRPRTRSRCMPVWLDAANGSSRRQACRLLLGARQHDAERHRDPARNVPRPRRQPAVDDARFKGATPAFYYQGKGISCDDLPGYTKTGEMVGYGGHGDPGGYTYMAKN